ncbi:MAG: L-serine ammonia-lyase [Candidatus Schmidhempelia sp.]|nr:L-serine ammonia-lyase [Candidatus Schmidhempelia sp.]
MGSVFDIFKIGVGPSSSHTVGPMKAGKQFIDELITLNIINKVTRLQVDVYGSLSLTGKGHQTDVAIIMGLAGNAPDKVDIDTIPRFIQQVAKQQRLVIYDGKYEVDFSLETSMSFHTTFLPIHENGMTLTAYANEQQLYCQTYYSIGGGKIITSSEIDQPLTTDKAFPFPFTTAKQLLNYCHEHSLSISSIIMRNELQLHSAQEIQHYFIHVGQVMNDCITRGINTEGLLPGPLRVPRRAFALHRLLMSQNKMSTDPMVILDWVNMFALAVCEENAAGGRVVTAPTNGACGIIPAILAYYDQFVKNLTPDLYVRFFMTSGAIGMLYQSNASISGAEVGCQGEVGVACSMAAAGLAELLGGNPEQVCMAAEIAMEHNLGLTCDPIGGQVQVPCIERNAIAAVKAINAARMALRRSSAAKVSLDNVIATMYETGKDMHAKYRETSLGGLAVTVSYCD